MQTTPSPPGNSESNSTSNSNSSNSSSNVGGSSSGSGASTGRDADAAARNLHSQLEATVTPWRNKPSTKRKPDSVATKKVGRPRKKTMTATEEAVRDFIFYADCEREQRVLK